MNESLEDTVATQTDCIFIGICARMKNMIANRIKAADNQVKSNLLRWILICCGWLSIAGGVIGIFLPLVPTVPFLLLAAACFARSSGRFHTWLVEHGYLGPLIRDYLNGSGIPSRARRMAIGMVWVSFPASTFLFVQVFWLKIMLMSIAAVITLYLLSLPTSSPIHEDSSN